MVGVERVLAVCPLIGNIHQVSDGLWIVAAKLLFDLSLVHTAVEGIDFPFLGDVLRDVLQDSPPLDV
jgi:hypothetical protein